MRYRIFQEKIDTPAGPRWRNLVVVQEMSSGRLAAVGRTLAHTMAYTEHLRGQAVTLDEIHRLPVPSDMTLPGAEMRWTGVRTADHLELYRLLTTEEPAGAEESPTPQPPPADTRLIPGIGPSPLKPSRPARNHVLGAAREEEGVSSTM